MKPYSAYKDSGIEWIGGIPEGWDVIKIKYIATNDVDYGLNISGENYVENGIRFLRTTDIDDFGNLKQNGVYLNQDDVDNNFLLHNGDLLISRSGTIGRAYVHKGTNDLFSFAGYLVRFSFSDINISKFIYYLTKSNIFEKWLKSISVESTIGNVNGQKYANYQFALPSIEEIQTIINYLNLQIIKIDTLIENKQKQIELLKEERTAIINQAVTKGLNPDVPMRDSGIEWLGEIPEHWELRKLKYLSSINPTKSNSSFNKNSDELVTFLPMEKVSEDGDIDTRSKKPIKDLWDGLTYFEENDVIVSKITPCFENGKGAFLKNLGSKIGFGSTEFHVLRAKISEIHPHYLYYVTRTNMFKKLGEAAMTGAAGQKRVTNSFIQNFFVSFPTKLEEQDEIVRQIKLKQSSMDELISQIQQQITLLQEYRTALISETVTGKIDLRNQHEFPTPQ